MAKSNLSFDELLTIVEDLPYSDFEALIKHYSEKTGKDYEEEKSKYAKITLQKRLEALGINLTCPNQHCKSDDVVKWGTRKGIQIYRCKECHKKFSIFTGTVLDNTRWHWDIWVKMLEMTINDYSLHNMKNVLEKDFNCLGIDIKTIWTWRLKLMHALATLPMPQLTGVIQIDETFIRETQKGSRTLISYVKGENREPRYGYSPSNYGTLGSEFATVVTAIDNRGFCVCKVTSLGAVKKELFLDTFDPYIVSPSFICTDRNKIYRDYCKHKKYAHYERPSNYLETLNKAGYVSKIPTNPTKAKRVLESNADIINALYKDGDIDQIFSFDGKRAPYSYDEFNKIKNANSLSLARVNELHSDIKKFIKIEKTNVSTKYLSDYIGFFTYIRNWRVKYGKYPSSMVDAELILREVIRSRINFTSDEIEGTELSLPKPTGQYMRILKAETEKARFAAGNKYFKFNVEDGFKTFNKRDYLLDLPNTKLRKIGKECHIKGYSTMNSWVLASNIMKHPNFNEILYRLLNEDRTNPIDEEDLKAIEAGKYVIALKKKRGSPKKST